MAYISVLPPRLVYCRKPLNNLNINPPPMPCATDADRNMNGSGCVFDHFGRVPPAIYTADELASPLETAVYKNDIDTFKNLVKGGHVVTVGLKIGEMTCIEYAAMMGYADILGALLDESVNAGILKEYFSLPDVVDRAYLISTKKVEFFKKEALAEANRYEAALFTAVEYDRPECVALMLKYLGPREPNKHKFYTKENFSELLSACELASARGHEKCFDILNRRRNSCTFIPFKE